jgi:hypothetical protein
MGLLFNNIYKRTWYVDTVGTNSIKQERVLKGDFAWTALINLSYRTEPNTRVGLAGVSLLDGGMRYALGGHTYFGERDLLGISVVSAQAG